MKALSLLFLSATVLFASIDGTVINRTTSKPQAGVSVTLVKPGQQGMQTLGTTVTDASGHFVFQMIARWRPAVAAGHVQRRQLQQADDA